MNIAALIRALREMGGEVSDDIIAEALWMLQYLPDVDPRDLQNRGEADAGTSVANTTDLTQQVGEGSEESEEGEDFSELFTENEDHWEWEEDALDGDDEVQSTAQIRAAGSRGGFGTTRVRTTDILVPGAPALRNRLAYTRALRTLSRRTRSHTRVRIDEEATIRRLAEERVFLPVQRSVSERWLDLSLVLDRSRSMDIWSRLLNELRALFVRLGLFRNVRLWALDADGNTPVLQLEAQRGRVGAVSLAPRALVDQTGRSLVLVISDCVGSAWQTGMMHEALDIWGKAGPTAILQVLPRQLWVRSSLGQGYPVALSGGPGLPSARLKIRPASRRTLRREANQGVRVPVINIEPDAFRAWAQMLAGSPDSASPGYILPLPRQYDRTERRHISSQSEVSDEQAVTDFLRVTSPLMYWQNASDQQRLAHAQIIVASLYACYVQQHRLTGDIRDPSRPQPWPERKRPKVALRCPLLHPGFPQ